MSLQRNMCRPTPQNAKIYFKVIFGFAEVAKHICVCMWKSCAHRTKRCRWQSDNMAIGYFCQVIETRTCLRGAYLHSLLAPFARSTLLHRQIRASVKETKICKVKFLFLSSEPTTSETPLVVQLLCPDSNKLWIFSSLNVFQLNLTMYCDFSGVLDHFLRGLISGDFI